MPRIPICLLLMASAVSAVAVAAQPVRQTLVRDRAVAPERPIEVPEAVGVVKFDSSISISGSAWFELERGGTGYELDGTPRHGDDPRWAPPRLIADAEQPELIASSEIVRTYAGGLSHKAEPIVVCLDVNRSHLLIHRGPRDAIDYWSGAAHRTYRKALRQGDRPSDLLVGQSNTLPDHAFAPAAAVVWNGFIGVACAVRERTSTAEGDLWLATRTALVWTTSELLETDPEPWRIGGISRPSAAMDAKTLLQHWSISLFPIDPSRAVVFLADYRAPAIAKDGGSLDAYAIIRAGGTVASVTGVNLMESVLAGQHCHVGGMTVSAEGRVDVYASYGDTMRANKLDRRSLPPGGQWSSGLSDPASGIGGSYRLQLPSDDWGPTVSVWGAQHPQQTHHNQLISMVPGDKQLRTILCGGDENGASILRLSTNEDTGAARIETVYQPQVTSNPEDGVLVFGLQAMDAGGPYLAVQTGPGWSADEEMHGRILYSKDGTVWGHLPWTGISEQCPAVFEGDSAVVSGSIIPGYFKRVQLGPDQRTVRPLAVSSAGAENMLAVGDAIRPESPPPGVAISRVVPSDLVAMGIPPPPSHTQQMFRISSPGVSTDLGRWRLTAPGHPFSGQVLSGGVSVRAWVRSLGPELGGPPNTATLSASPVATSPAGAVVGQRASGFFKFDPGAWTPVTIWLDARPNSGAFYAAPPGPHRIDLDLAAMASEGRPNPADLLICFESISVGSPTIGGHGAAPGVEPTERAVVGFPPSAEWTIYFESFVPEHLWDARTGSIGSASRPEAAIASVVGTAGTLRLTLRPGLGTMSLSDASGTVIGPVRTTYPVRGSDLRIAVTSGPAGTRLRYAIAGMTPRDVVLDRPFNADRIEFGEAGLDLSNVLIFDERMTMRQLDLLFLNPPVPSIAVSADTNGDGRIDADDLRRFLERFRAGDPRADLDRDGTVQKPDLAAFLQAMRACR